MNAKKFFLIVLLAVLVIAASGCMPAAATQAPIAVEKMAEPTRSYFPPQPQEQKPYQPPQPPAEPTMAPAMPQTYSQPPLPPAATEAPAYQPWQPTARPPIAADGNYSPSAPVYPTQSPYNAGPQDNYFQNYGVNPYQDTREDHLSTFGLDVDTASYNVARRYVQDGVMPPADSIRVEEFVNSFNMDYATPPDVAFAVYADGSPSPYDYQTTLLRIGVQGYRVPESQRKQANLTFVIDISGSMNMENRLGLVKQSLRMLVDRLRSSDMVTIVVYGSDARTVLSPTWGDRRNEILWAIDSLQPEGSTNAEAGLNLGYQWAMQTYREGSINRVILCSDGVANVGTTNANGLLDQVGRYVQNGITLTTVGFGMGNFNDVLLEQLADRGNGNYSYIDDLEEARELFVEDLTSTLQVIAMDAKVQVDFNPDVVAYYRLIGYENRAVADQDFRNDAVDAGEIGAGHSATALYAVRLQPQAQGRVATVQLRWKDPDQHTVKEINGNLNSWDLYQSFDEAPARYQLAVTVAQYAELLRGSPWARGSTFSQVANYASRLGDALPQDEQVREFADLVWRASRLAGW